MRELFRELVIAKQRAEAAHDRDMSLAWHVAALTRGTKGLPRLQSLFAQKRSAKGQSAAEQIAMWQLAATRFGGTFRPADLTVRVMRG